MPWFVYIIECRNGSLYTGITTDLKRRISEHRSGKGCRYTSYNPGRKLRYSQRFRVRSAAAKREAEIKKLTRADKTSLIRSRQEQ